MDTEWKEDLEGWLEPFLSALGHKTRRRMCPAYIAGLIGPGDRKSVQPMASRASEIGYDQLHHFVAAGVWDSAPLEKVLVQEADRLVGDAAGFLVIDDTALPKKGTHSVGVGGERHGAVLVLWAVDPDQAIFRIHAECEVSDFVFALPGRRLASVSSPGLFAY